MDTNENLKTAVLAAIAAGKEILNIYHTRDFDVDYKEDASPLTKADIAAHKCILSHLAHTGIPILSEEGRDIPYSERKDWEYLWIVDPLDGTKEFVKRNGEFTVNIALVHDQVPVLGVIYVPVTGTLYFSSTQLGAYKSSTQELNKDLDMLFAQAKKLPINKTRDTYVVVASKSHLSAQTEAFIEDLKKKHEQVSLLPKGSSLKLCMIAEGTADCYPRFSPTMEWDTAAGQAIVEAAGYSVLDWETREHVKYNREDLVNSWFIVC